MVTAVVGGMILNSRWNDNSSCFRSLLGSTVFSYVKQWTRSRQAESWSSTTTSVHTFVITTPTSDLSRRVWTRLNLPRSGIGWFDASMLNWGLAQRDRCDREEQLTESSAETSHPPYTWRHAGTRRARCKNMRMHGFASPTWTSGDGDDGIRKGE